MSREEDAKTGTESRGGPPELGVQPLDPLPPERSPEGKSRPRRTWLAWSALALLAIFATVQAAGILLRDRVEGRVTPVAAPPLALEPAPVPQSPSVDPLASASRFGPEVREVAVASVPEPAADAASAGAQPKGEPPQGTGAQAQAPVAQPSAPTPQNPPPEPASEPKKLAPASQSKVDGASAKKQEEPRPERAARAELRPSASEKGEFVLQLGMYRSQKYRREIEKKLSDMGIPHFRVEGTQKGRGFRLDIAAQNPEERAKARGTLQAAGYIFAETAEGLQVHFFEEQGVREALTLLNREGLKAGYERTDGTIPVWTVYAGAFSEPDAQKVRDQLAEAGVKSNLRRKP